MITANGDSRIAPLATEAQQLTGKRLNTLLDNLEKRRAENLQRRQQGARIGTPLYKRAMDLAIAVPALLVASPVMLVVAILLKLESKAPIFYKSKRVGANYKVFDLIKFRSMVPGADKKVKDLSHLNLYNQQPKAEQMLCSTCIANGTMCIGVKLINEVGEEICENLYLEKKEQESVFMKFKDDPRITPLGKFMRNTSIDELPQLFNIIRGDMSLVGNRPLPLYEAEKLTTDISFKRFDAPAGLTGLWQVTKRGKSKMSDEERIALDNEYAQRYNLWLDLQIIFRTFYAVFQKESS